jgi:hypothetical protein
MGTRKNKGDAALIEQRAERRETGRVPFRMPLRATIYASPGCKGDTARMCHLLAQDLSGSGVSLIYARPFPIGQRIGLEMPDRARTVEVCRVISLSDGHYLAGCEFVD